MIHAFDRLPRRLGDHFLIYGAGTIGLMVGQLAPRSGAASVTMIDTSPDRAEVAEDVGIEKVITSAEQLDDAKFEVVVDCTGNPKAIVDGMSRLKAGGAFLQIGVTSPEASIPLSPFQVYRNEISIMGSLIVQGSFRRAVEMFEAGALNHKKMISHSYPLDKFDQAMEDFRSGKGRKLQIRPQDSEIRTF